MVIHFSFVLNRRCQVTLIDLIRRVVGDDLLFSSKPGLGAASVSSKPGTRFEDMDSAVAFDLFV